LAKASPGKVILGLAVVFVLALSGCGGGGDSEGQSQSTGNADSAAQVKKEQAGTPSSSKTSQGNQGQGKAQAGSDAAATPQQGAGKQAPPITPPEGKRERGATPQERAEATVASISLSSPALTPGPESKLMLPATYTCDGKDSWPAFEWSGVPAGTAQLDLFIMNLAPVDEKVFFDWAVAGIDPDLTHIDAGELPKGTVTGTNSFGKRGYSICPPGQEETYIAALYALPEALPAKPGFEPLARREAILGQAGNVGLLAPTYAH
jgi:phosphatidylethanolamine-binding protein (PEBP) family uncharacterized protein